LTANQRESEPDRLKHAVEAGVGVTFRGGHKVDVLCNGVEIFPSMLEAIRSAESTIDFVTFVYWTGDVARRFADAFSERSRSGVRVRVILDAFGSAQMDEALIDQMAAAGVAIERFRPTTRAKFWESDHRTHRKILVVDNRIGFTGGVGIAEEWEGDARNPSEWRDTHFRIEGPGVLELKATFLTDWRDTGHPIDPSDIGVEAPPEAGEVQLAIVDASAQIGFNDAQRALETLIAASRHGIALQTPYFNPTDTIVGLMKDALARGVEIDVLVPGPQVDKRISDVMAQEMYLPLLEEGARVWRYQPSMMHVKCVIVDDALSLVGSVNVNRRSVEKDEEVALIFIDDDVTATLQQHFEEDVSRSLPADSAADRDGVGELAARLLKPIKKEM
jgi:cardiolipin synthase